jgi:enamine deaminase RidA (YjgF/YER057c/UK114 family)
MTRTAVSSDQAPDALGPYSQAIVAGGLVFCSGMAGIDPATGAIADGIEAQTEQALLNLAAVLSAAGSSMDNVGQDDDLLRQRRGLRPPQRGLRPAHARSTTGAVCPGRCAAAPRPARLDRGDRSPTKPVDLASEPLAALLGREPDLSPGDTPSETDASSPTGHSRSDCPSPRRAVAAPMRPQA